MTIARWKPPVAPTRQEQFLLKRVDRVRKLLGFLRVHRHELFDEGFQEELASVYRTTGAGKDALPPGMMAMATLVQGYLGISDAEMVELTVVDLRVQMVLGCLGAEKPACSQGALQEFRERLIAADLDRRVLERTVELAKQTKEFDYRKLPKTLRVAVDSSRGFRSSCAPVGSELQIRERFLEFAILLGLCGARSGCPVSASAGDSRPPGPSRRRAFRGRRIRARQAAVADPQSFPKTVP